MRDRPQHEFARQPHAADALDDDPHGRIVDHGERIGAPALPVHVARLVRVAHGDRAQEPGMGGDEPARDGGADDPAAQQADATRARGGRRRALEEIGGGQTADIGFLRERQ